MRPIRFRGERLDNGGWVYGSLIIFHDWGGNRRVQIVDDVGNIYEVDPATVGQFTGLNDKNGKEIYEGDVLRWHNDYPPKVVLWFVCQFDAGTGESSMPLLVLKDKYALEVIGNIHDNPELLKTE